MKVNFYKYQGTGNDFVILDNYTCEVPQLTTEQIKFICNRNFGVGADGLMILSKKEGVDFEMIYYNADGNQSSMCGNGGRCLVKFAYHRGIHKSTYHFIAIDGIHKAILNEDGTVRLKMKNVNNVDYHTHHSIVNTGSPHFIKFVENVESLNVPFAGHEIRYSTAFKNEGINVNFVEVLDEDSIYVRTYERGVENETLSCGTGVTAAALMSAHNQNGFNTVEVKTKGGKLSVEFNKIDKLHFEDIWLCGPATVVFSGEINV